MGHHEFGVSPHSEVLADRIRSGDVDRGRSGQFDGAGGHRIKLKFGRSVHPVSIALPQDAVRPLMIICRWWFR